MLPQHPTSLIDCTEAGGNKPGDNKFSDNESGGTELIVVEGVSAANAVKAVRDRRLQAVLPMQGKVPNAKRTSTDRLLLHPNIADLLQSIHPKRTVETQLDEFRYQRVVILAESDADGVHAAILLLLFFQLHVPALIEQGRLLLVRAPLFGFFQRDECVAVAYSETHAAKVYAELTDKGHATLNKRHYKGVASLDKELRLSLLAQSYAARTSLTPEDCRKMCSPFS